MHPPRLVDLSCCGGVLWATPPDIHVPAPGQPLMHLSWDGWHSVSSCLRVGLLQDGQGQCLRQTGTVKAASSLSNWQLGLQDHALHALLYCVVLTHLYRVSCGRRCSPGWPWLALGDTFQMLLLFLRKWCCKGLFILHVLSFKLYLA